MRVAFNRDERLDRIEAAPPVVVRYGIVGAVHPVDPEGSGTWIAGTTERLVFTLMNEAETGEDISSPVSRGLVIPSLLSATGLDDVEARLARYPADRHRPFRLLVVGSEGVVEAVRTAGCFTVTREPAVARLVRTSSSLDPDGVCPRRVALFESVVDGASQAAQDRFHAHRWPDAPGASVLMSRGDARTVSVTVVELFDRILRLTYRALPAGPPDVTELVLAA